MKKARKTKIIFLLSLFLFVSIYIGINEYQIYKENKKENEIIDQFLEEQKITRNKEEKEEDKKEEETKYDYIAVLEIPKINLRKGIVDINSKYNDINYNVEIINSSQMPDMPNSNIIIAAHSGNTNISFFRYLYKISKGDIAIIYYQNVKYTYEVNTIENEDKNGWVTIRKSNNKNTLTLTTCNQEDKTKQIVIVCNLVRVDKL